MLPIVYTINLVNYQFVKNSKFEINRGDLCGSFHDSHGVWCTNRTEEAFGLSTPRSTHYQGLGVN